MFLALCKCYVLAAQTKLPTDHNVTYHFMVAYLDFLKLCSYCPALDIPTILAPASPTRVIGDHAASLALNGSHDSVRDMWCTWQHTHE
jgi:hypothetical protein